MTFRRASQSRVAAWACIWLCLPALQLSAQAVDGAALVRAVGAGDAAAVRQIMAGTTPTALDEAFLDGLILKANGRLPEALAVFDRILDTDAAYLNARRERAHTLLLDRQYREARQEFLTLLRVDPSGEMGRTYRRFLRQIANERPVSVRAFVSVSPSSNTNRGASGDQFETDIGTFEIDPDSQATPGVVLQFGILGDLRQRIDSGHRLRLGWGVLQVQRDEAVTAFDLANGNLLVLDLDLALEGRMSETRWSIGLFGRDAIDEGDGDYRDRGMQGGIVQGLQPGRLARAGFRFTDRRYDVQTFRDGPIHRLDLGLTERLRPGLFVGVDLSLERAAPEAEHLRYDAVGVLSRLTRDWPNGASGEIRLGYTSRQYLGDFPLTTRPRMDEERRVGVAVAVPWFSIAGRVPALSCDYLQHDSSIALYDYEVFECGVRLDFDL